MPTRSPHPCSKHPWQLVKSGAGCPECVVQPALTHRKRRYDGKRQSAAKRGYGHKWREYRKEFFSVPRLCACCGQPATIHNADVDHVVPVNGPSDPLFWKRSNHQALIHGHHSMKTRQQNSGPRPRG